MLFMMVTAGLLGIVGLLACGLEACSWAPLILLCTVTFLVSALRACILARRHADPVKVIAMPQMPRFHRRNLSFAATVDC